MLCEITIENVAVIEKACASFVGGFNVLTGETGAGKSILIDSINAILGNRTSRDIVRSGADKAKIWATFRGVGDKTKRQLEEAGYECEEELLLYREITAEGKSTCRVNGQPATAAILRDICGRLINIHGQHDNQSLLDPARHLSVLDAYAHNEELLSAYAGEYTKLTALQRETDSLQMDEAEKNRKLDLLRYEVDEIDGADLTAGEEEDLTERRKLIQNAQSIQESLAAAYMALQGDDDIPGAVSLLRDASNQMTQAAGYAAQYSENSETLSELYYTAGELASDIGAKLDSFGFDASALNEIEVRLDQIYRLKQKYGPTLEAVLEYGEKARAELEKIEFSSDRLAALEKETAEALAAAQSTAQTLNESRRAAFEKLQGEIASALDFLNMPGIVMVLNRQEKPLGPDGQDDISFYISTNPGEAPKPLAKIASGGELARIMLAIKSAVADKDEVETVIYDEIDTGISGLAAGRIGQLLEQTAQGRQVICVTHTAQIAAYAQQHLLIQKQVRDGRTYTGIQPLEDTQRAEELARIISGEAVTDLARANAKEMLRRAGH